MSLLPDQNRLSGSARLASSNVTDRVPAFPPLFDQVAWDAFAKAFELTTRERQVAELLSRGCTNDEIAKRLECEPTTIRTFCRSVYAKTGCTKLGRDKRLEFVLTALHWHRQDRP